MKFKFIALAHVLLWDHFKFKLQSDPFYTLPEQFRDCFCILLVCQSGKHIQVSKDHILELGPILNNKIILTSLYTIVFGLICLRHMDQEYNFVSICGWGKRGGAHWALELK